MAEMRQGGNSLIEVSHLTKRYGGHTALADVSFSIPEGQITGLLGPNGAGKSTTMNILTGCLAPSSGSVRINGIDILEDPYGAKRCLGYLPEQPPLYPDRTPEEYLKFVARAKGVERPAQAAEEVMERTGLTEMGHRLTCNLSKGYRQRLGIAQAILGDPKLIILDEPTVGLDPLQITQIRDLIRDLGRDRTVILSSHILAEVQAVCSNILILSGGRLVAQGTPAQLRQLRASASLDLEAEVTAQEAQALTKGLPDCKAALEPMEARRLRIRLETSRDNLDSLARQVFFRFAQAGKPILRMTQERASLEDIFLELTKEESK